MAPKLNRSEFSKNGHTTSYLAGGPAYGPLLIFLHGWPGIAATWTRQLEAFAALGFRVVAPDMRGYGHSSVPADATEYRLETLVQDALALLAHLQRPEAIWIGHDWGSAVVWGVAEHHPEVCRALINLTVPSHSMERGLDAVLPLVNRDIYPEKEYPYGQWDYQVFYEMKAEWATAQFAANSARSVKTSYINGVPANYGKPSRTSTIVRDNGRFSGAAEAPDTPLDQTVFADDEPLFREVADAMERTGWSGATAYYLNHKANAAYAKEEANGGKIDAPVLFIEAKYDPVCSTSLDRLSEPMRRNCRDLSEASVEAGHWVQLEKPHEVNALIARWLVLKAEDWWPNYWTNPLTVRPKKN